MPQTPSGGVLAKHYDSIYILRPCLGLVALYSRLESRRGRRYRPFLFVEIFGPVSYFSLALSWDKLCRAILEVLFCMYLQTTRLFVSSSDSAERTLPHLERYRSKLQ